MAPIMDLPAAPFQFSLSLEGELLREDEIGSGEGLTRCLPCDAQIGELCQEVIEA